MVMNHDTGNDEETFSIKIHFKEFVRLNIGSSWYRIASYYPWRAHFNFQKRNGKWRNSNATPSLIETNNDGW